MFSKIPENCQDLAFSGFPLVLTMSSSLSILFLPQFWSSRLFVFLLIYRSGVLNPRWGGCRENPGRKVSKEMTGGVALLFP